MRVRFTGRISAFALFLSLIVAFSFGADLILPAHAQSSDIAVIVNPNNSVTNLSLTDLRKILAGQKRIWPGSVPVKIIVRGPGCRERLTLLRILGMSENEYKQYWTAQVIRGEADAEPAVMPSFGMIKEALKAFPGAIALADARDVKPGMDLKVIKVEGHMPGEVGYPIH